MKWNGWVCSKVFSETRTSVTMLLVDRVTASNMVGAGDKGHGTVLAAWGGEI